MISPCKYAQQKRKEFVGGISNEAADMIVARFFIEPQFVARLVGEIPNSIPEKYHRRIRNILITGCIGAMCENATYYFSMKERNNMLHKALMYTGNVRES